MKMKIFILFVCMIFSACFSASALNIKIVESETFNSGHLMDSVWFNVAAGMGHTASIVPQTTLDNNSFFSTTDILIISSGVITLPANRVLTIQQFLQTGKPVYIQSEYDCGVYTTNAAFATIVGNLGGNFSWMGVVSGTLAPMNVLGSLATTGNTITPLSYFWYGCHGSGCANIENYLEYNGDYFGFIFCPPNPNYGRFITNSDQDWINQSVSLPLMQNIITNLADPNYQCNASGGNLFLGNDTTLCTGQQLVLDAGNPGATYLWSTGATTRTIHAAATAGYYVSVNVGGCLLRDTIYVTFTNIGNLDLGNDTILCNGQHITLDANNPGASYAWSTGATSRTITVFATGNYSVIVNDNGCQKTDSVLITIKPSLVPLIIADGPLTICPHDSVKLQADSAYINYSWSNGSTASSVTIAATGTYFVTVTDADGCSGISNDVSVSVSDDFCLLEIPNVITPNGDNMNDFFVINKLPRFSQLTIFNRWGKEVYSSNDYRNNWDGGRQVTGGIYYYLLVLKKGASYKGYLEVIK
jgi:gliding motility-associated-like protein